MKEQDKDHGAELAAVGTDTGSSPTEAASDIQSGDWIRYRHYGAEMLSLAKSADTKFVTLWSGTRIKRSAVLEVRPMVIPGLAFQVAQLRHAYHQLHQGTVRDQPQFADGLIAPVIRMLEQLSRQALAGNQTATEVSSTPAASAAQK